MLIEFLSKEEDAYGRPVDVAIDERGALLVADDVGNVVWIVSVATGNTATTHSNPFELFFDFNLCQHKAHSTAIEGDDGGKFDL